MMRYLLVDDVCERYRCSKKVVHDKTRTLAMPFLKRPGWRALMFNPDHLDAWDDGAPLETVALEDGGTLVRPKASEGEQDTWLTANRSAARPEGGATYERITRSERPPN